MKTNTKDELIKSIWIIGLAQSGKTTLARLLVTRLQQNGYPSLLLDGNETRNLFQNKYGFDESSRRKQTRRISALAKWIIRQNSVPVVAIVHPFEDDRMKCRRDIPGYYEVYLKCSLKECIDRDRKNIYRPVIEGKQKFVVGLDIKYEEPIESQMVLDSEKLTPEESLERLWTRISDKLVDNRLGRDRLRL